MVNTDLTRGSILKVVLRLTIPIMGASFVQMAYNMTDMIWIGRLGTKAVSAVGSAGFYTWLAMAFILISKTGAEIGISQSVGKSDVDEAKKYIACTILINILLGVIYAIVLIVFRDRCIGFFGLSDKVKNMGIDYLVIVSLGMNFCFINPVFTAIFNGYGDSKTPFFINGIGLLINMILDPMLIFGFGIIPKLGTTGAGIATVTAQMMVSGIFVYKAKKDMPLFKNFNLIEFYNKDICMKILKLGMPVAIYNACFTIFSMILGKIIGFWGDTPIGVQKVGSQIEAISWMSAGGLSTALSAFVGQNFGAKKLDRIIKGFCVSMGVAIFIGIISTYLLYCFPAPIFSLFIPDDEYALKLGVDYLKILGLSQLFMCIEITTTGAFNGMGKTIVPAIISIIFTGIRIPIALFLSKESILGLNGIWWSITISSILKGIILVSLFVVYMFKHNEYREVILSILNKKEKVKIN